MGKYLVKSSLHDNREIVVIIPDVYAIMYKAVKSKRLVEPYILEEFLIEGLDHMEAVLLKDIFSSELDVLPEKIVFSQKEALGMIKQERDKLELGLIDLKEYDKRKGEWAKYIK